MMWERLGLALVHFVWQGALAALIVAIVAACFPRGRGRYATYLAGTVLMLACPPVTLAFLGTRNDASTTTAGIPLSAAWTSPHEDVIAVKVNTQAAIASPMSPRLESRWLATAVWVWLIGAALLSLRLPLAWLTVARLRRSAEAIDLDLRARVDALAARLHVRRAVRVLISRHVVQPVVMGCVRPAILLPVSILCELSPSMLDAVIAHELAHVRRHDLWVIYAQRLAETLLFYHPAVWWISSRLSAEREICCDEIAVVATGGRSREYASALERAAQLAFVGAPSAALAFGGRRHATLDRVCHILGLSPARPALGWTSGVTAIGVVAALFVLGCGFAKSRSIAVAAQQTPAISDPARKPRVLLVTEGDFFMEHAVRAIDWVQTDVITPQRYDADAADAAGQYDVVMFHQWLPSGRLPAVNTMFWDVVPPSLRPGGTVAVDAPIDLPDPGHQTVRGLDLSKVQVRQLQRMNDQGMALARVDHLPAIVEYHPDVGQTNLVVAFDPRATGWPVRASFAVFVNNALQLLTGRSPATQPASPATTQAAQRSVPLIFQPRTSGSGKSSWTAWIHNPAFSPHPFMFVTAYRGDSWTVTSEAGGQPALRGKLVDGDANQVLVDIDEVKQRKHALILPIDRPIVVEIGGQTYRLTYSQTQVAADTPQFADYATIMVSSSHEAPPTDQRTSGTSRRTATTTTTTPTTSSKNP